MQLRTYQRQAVNDCLRGMRAGSPRMCLVAPTGSGKTVMAFEVIKRAIKAGAGTLAVVHRRELVSQILERFGDVAAARCPGFPEDETKMVQVTTIQTFISRPSPMTTLLLLDECHHYAADEWKAVTDKQWPRILGMTATPERADHKPLGNLFDGLVVAASYPELIEQGYLVPTDVVGPDTYIGPELNQDPVDAYLEYCPGERAFCFVGSVEYAYRLCQQFRDRAIGCHVIEANTSDKDREYALKAFKAGSCKVLVNVYILTEGVDVPEAYACILARGCQHTSTYLQMVGRVKRPAQGKQKSLLIDLTGAKNLHGSPDLKRVYSLERGIEIEKPLPVFECPRCGNAFPKPFQKCQDCGFVKPPEIPRIPKIYDKKLAMVYAGASTPEGSKKRELARLLAVYRRMGFSLFWVVQQYEKLFGEKPDFSGYGRDEKYTEYKSNLKYALGKGYKPGWAAWRYKEVFSQWPPRHWKERVEKEVILGKRA